VPFVVVLEDDRERLVAHVVRVDEHDRAFAALRVVKHRPEHQLLVGRSPSGCLRPHAHGTPPAAHQWGSPSA
jgi:hypothetical protein